MSITELQRFLPEHGKIFLEYQSRLNSPQELAHSGFAPHIIWSDLLEYRWAILDDMFCLFATAHGVTHLALPPFGAGSLECSTHTAFQQMAHMNPSHIPSRIDNVDASSAFLLKKAGYVITPLSCDYLYQREAITKLAGDRFHSQRGAYNQAERLKPAIRPFLHSDTAECLALFAQWVAVESTDSLNLMMREDARFAHHAVMKGYRELCLTGRVVEVNKRIVGYTFGFPLSQETFCVLLEITNKSVRGLSAWIFREFCHELSSYTFINTMDDSGLPKLAHAKALWCPVRMIPSYTIN